MRQHSSGVTDPLRAGPSISSTGTKQEHSPETLRNRAVRTSPLSPAELPTGWISGSIPNCLRNKRLRGGNGSRTRIPGNHSSTTTSPPNLVGIPGETCRPFHSRLHRKPSLIPSATPQLIKNSSSARSVPTQPTAAAKKLIGEYLDPLPGPSF